MADSIEMTTWANGRYFLGAQDAGPVANFSPDGKEFVILLRRGSLETNSNIYSVYLFHSGKVFKNPKPELLVSMSSNKNRPAIEEVKWLGDSRTISFLGENRGQASQVYLLDIHTRCLTKLTDQPSSVSSYDISSDGRKVVFLADPPSSRSFCTRGTETREDSAVVITTQTLQDLLARSPCIDDSQYVTDEDLFVQFGHRPARRIPTAGFLSAYYPLSLSPGSRYALLVVEVAEVPEWWQEYEDPDLTPYISERRGRGASSHLTRYMLLDLTTGKLSPLLDTPMPWFNTGFAWSDDDRSLVLSGAYLPLDTARRAERERRERTAFVVEVSLPSRKINEITDESAGLVKWNSKSGRLLLESHDGQGEIDLITYVKSGGSWTRVASGDGQIEKKAPFEISLEEDINHPPRLWVTSDDGLRRSLLYDLNPQFASIHFAHVEAVTWKASDGHTVSGGLYFPVDYETGKRYPLVIQTHGFAKDRFWFDGPWNSAFAAQPLAAQGIFVLQVGYSPNPREDAHIANTPEEAPRQMAAYEGAIDYLDQRGLIDRSHVGIIGFSRTVYAVAYTLTHSRDRFVAATMADGFDGGYVNYILWGGADYVAVNGGSPLGNSLGLWFKNSPGFNLNKVNAAIRLEDYGSGKFLGGWEWFSGLTQLDKPVDLVWIPCGVHLLVKPWERMASQQGNVDWFRFWLKGEEDPFPAKRRQYERWRALRTMADIVKSSTSRAESVGR